MAVKLLHEVCLHVEAVRVPFFAAMLLAKISLTFSASYSATSPLHVVQRPAYVTVLSCVKMPAAACCITVPSFKAQTEESR